MLFTANSINLAAFQSLSIPAPVTIKSQISYFTWDNEAAFGKLILLQRFQSESLVSQIQFLFPGLYDQKMLYDKSVEDFSKFRSTSPQPTLLGSWSYRLKNHLIDIESYLIMQLLQKVKRFRALIPTNSAPKFFLIAFIDLQIEHLRSILLELTGKM